MSKRRHAEEAIQTLTLLGGDEQASAVRELIEIRDLAVMFFNQVIPQGDRLVLDIGVANSLGLLMTQYKTQ